MVDVEVASLADHENLVPTLTSDSVRIALERALDDGKIGSEVADPGYLEVQESTKGKLS